MKNKIEVVEKFIKGRLVGDMQARELQRINLAKEYKSKEDAIDRLFFDYLKNLITEQKDRDYWIVRYVN